MRQTSIVSDPWKSTRNKQKHGIDSAEAATVFRDPLLRVMPDVAHSQEEERWLALGKSFRQLLLGVVHSEDENRIRIISARKAEPKERREYEQT